jgi:Saxitoxin biosynthesis operon protein SxtJ
MLNPFKDVNWHPDLVARRKFAVSLMIGFPLIAAVLGGLGRWQTGAWNPFFLWLGLGGLGAGVGFWLLPQIAKPFYLAWYFFACCVGLVLSNLLLGAFFYLVLTPIGLLVRAAGRLTLRKGFDRGKGTYWQDAEKDVPARRYYRQF